MPVAYASIVAHTSKDPATCPVPETGGCPQPSPAPWFCKWGTAIDGGKEGAEEMNPLAKDGMIHELRSCVS